MRERVKKIVKAVLTPLLFAAAVSCINNDIPYPKIVAEITAFRVEGQTSDAVINTTGQERYGRSGRYCGSQACHPAAVQRSQTMPQLRRR